MDNDEARAVLADELRKWRGRSYSELTAAMDETWVIEVMGNSGASYQIEIAVFWDSTPNGRVRVLGSIDDGGWRAFLPLSDSFVVDAPDRARE